MPDDNLLQVDNLGVDIPTHGGHVQAVRGVSFTMRRGSTMALVGESGCGKSVTVQAMLGLMAVPGLRLAGSVHFQGSNLLQMDEAQLNRIRGAQIGMVFQDPLSAFNPTRTIGSQIAETLRVHRDMPKAEALAEARRLLDECRLSEPGKRVSQYPFELSGGMLQRAMIAMSLACGPDLLIADEPTTALDVTTQDQILWLMQQLQQSRGMAILLITHDLAVVARMAEEVAVMYAGQLVEKAPVDALFSAPKHPYTQALLRATPHGEMVRDEPLETIVGSPPDLFSPPTGCGFYPRCQKAMRICKERTPAILDVGASAVTRCWLHHPDYPQAAELRND
jgi:oligopeptide/dipeptide ABC transporter ATP-binding protein